MFRWFKNICKTYVLILLLCWYQYVCHPALCLNSSRLCRSFSSSSSGISAIHVRDSQPCSSSQLFMAVWVICFLGGAGRLPPLSLINLAVSAPRSLPVSGGFGGSSEVRMSLWVLAPQPLDSLEQISANQQQQQQQQQLQHKTTTTTTNKNHNNNNNYIRE